MPAELVAIARISGKLFFPAKDARGLVANMHIFRVRACKEGCGSVYYVAALCNAHVIVEYYKVPCNFCVEATSFSLQLLCLLGTRYAAELFAITLRGGLEVSFPTWETLILRYLVG